MVCRIKKKKNYLFFKKVVGKKIRGKGEPKKSPKIAPPPPPTNKDDSRVFHFWKSVEERVLDV